MDPGIEVTAQGYELLVGERGATVTGRDMPGLAYGVTTLGQLVRGAVGASSPRGRVSLPRVRVLDWPDFARRGVMLDVSRDKVPRLATLLGLIDRLADLKLNELQLYTEHTFAYRGHETVWRHASPLTGDDVLALDAACRARHVELVPNQNSFGHMHRWLRHEPYRALSEVPAGIEHPFSPDREPFGLCPGDPGSLTLLRDLYDQLLPHFSSRRFNVGLDETFDLGLGRSAERCEALGRGKVYLDFLLDVHREVGARGRRMELWGDIVLEHPEHIAALPRDTTTLVWGYEAGHPFSAQARRFAEAGLDFLLCPGTSSWNSLAGRTDNALSNIRSAALAGREHGASGLLTTDWGDGGHLQPLAASLTGFAAAALWSWNAPEPEEARGPTVAEVLDAHVLRDEAGVAGRALADLGNTHLISGGGSFNGTVLFWSLVRPDGLLPRQWTADLCREGFQAAIAHVDDTMARFGAARLGCDDAELVAEEVAWAADALRCACRIGMARLALGASGSLRALPRADREPLAPVLRRLVDRHRALWLRRNRPGGLADSAARLERTLLALEAG